MAFHRTAQATFEKLLREMNEVKRTHIDALHNVVQTTNMLLEFIEKDPQSTKTQRRMSQSLRSDPDFRLCREIANRAKHFRVSKDETELKGVRELLEGYGIGRYDKGKFGEEEQSVYIEQIDGTNQNALGYVRRPVAKALPLFAPKGGNDFSIYTP